jgi:hypothetical protein
MVEGVGSVCCFGEVSARRLLAMAVAWRWLWWFSAACSCRCLMVCSLFVLRDERDGASSCTKQKLCPPLAVLALLTPLGAGYLFKGVAVVFLSSPWRSSGASASKHPSWSFGSGSVGWCL